MRGAGADIEHAQAGLELEWTDDWLERGMISENLIVSGVALGLDVDPMLLVVRIGHRPWVTSSGRRIKGVASGFWIAVGYCEAIICEVADRGSLTADIIRRPRPRGVAACHLRWK